MVGLKHYLNNFSATKTLIGIHIAGRIIITCSIQSYTQSILKLMHNPLPQTLPELLYYIYAVWDLWSPKYTLCTMCY